MISACVYFPGDALGIYPQNNPPEVEYLINAMHCSGTEKVNKPSWAYQEAGFTKGEILLNVKGKLLIADIFQCLKVIFMGVYKNCYEAISFLFKYQMNYGSLRFSKI